MLQIKVEAGACHNVRSKCKRSNSERPTQDSSLRPNQPSRARDKITKILGKDSYIEYQKFAFSNFANWIELSQICDLEKVQRSDKLLL